MEQAKLWKLLFADDKTLIEETEKDQPNYTKSWKLQDKNTRGTSRNRY